MKFMKKIALSIGLPVFMLSSLASYAKQVTIDVLWFNEGIEGEVIRDLADRYEKMKNEQVKINITTVPMLGLEQRLKTMIAGKRPPAISRMFDVRGYENILEPLDDIYSTDVLVPTIRNVVTAYDGSVRALYTDMTINTMFYNKTLFDKAGISVPQTPDEIWSWDEFIAKLKIVKKEANVEYGLVWDVTPHRWSTLLFAKGGSLYQKGEKGEISVNPSEEEFIESLNYFKKLHDDGIMPKASWLGGEKAGELFMSGQIPAWITVNAVLGRVKDINSFEWGVTYLPYDKQRTSVPGGKIMGVFDTDVKEEAKEFIAYLAQPKINMEYAQRSGFLSPYKTANADLYKEYNKAYTIFYNEVQNSIEDAAYDWQVGSRTMDFYPQYKQEIQKVLMGKETAEQVTKNLKQYAQKGIKNYNRKIKEYKKQDTKKNKK